MWRLVTGTGTAPGESAGFTAPILAAPGSLNMAVDRALLESVQAGGAPVLRLYRWSPACLSFGRNQHTNGIYDPDRIQAAGLDVVRRPTGGLAVLHDNELTYSVAAPLALLDGARAAYHAISEALARGLAELGVAASLSTGAARRDPRSQTREPCFRTPAAGEVVAAGRKLIGSAQRCERRVLLQHGSILIAGSQSRIADLQVPVGDREAHAAAASHETEEAGTEPHDGTVTLDVLMGRVPGSDEVANAVVAGFRRQFGTCLAPVALTAQERERALAIEPACSDATWTWRQ